MNLFIQNLKDNINDMRWIRSYRKWKEVKKELELRREALASVVPNDHTIGFIRFLERRIAKLLHTKALVEVGLDKYQARWKIA